VFFKTADEMKKRVLIIEDDKDTSEMLGYLTEMLNFSYSASLSVLPASVIQILDPDLILLDNWVNGRSGSQLCLELKQNPLTSHIPVVLISAASNLELIAKDSRADHFIVKPFDIAELETAIVKYVNLHVIGH
jgi:DNA-binding response OmpR family regulator